MPFSIFCRITPHMEFSVPKYAIDTFVSLLSLGRGGESNRPPVFLQQPDNLVIFSRVFELKSQMS